MSSSKLTQSPFIERGKLQTAGNKLVDIVISASIYSKMYHKWRIDFNVTFTRALAKFKGSSSVLNIELQIEKTEHWAADQQLGVTFDWFNCTFQPLQLQIFAEYLKRLGGQTDGELCFYICLGISTFRLSTGTRPTCTLIFHIYNIPLSVWNTHFGSVYQHLWQ